MKPKIPPTCHPDRAYYAKGLCQSCYKSTKNAEARRAECHPERRAMAKGLCKACYNKARPKATCHPDRPVNCKGLCSRCYMLTWHYGAEPEQAKALADQRHCDICKQELSDPAGNGHRRGTEGHIDHDHVTGKIRGVLCGRCNVGLGMLRDSETALIRAIEYLKKD